VCFVVERLSECVIEIARGGPKAEVASKRDEELIVAEARGTINHLLHKTISERLRAFRRDQDDCDGVIRGD